MTKIDFKTYLNGVGNDLKTCIDDVIGIIIGIHEDVEKLKFNSLKPNKEKAKAILEYLAMEDCKSKKNMEALCGEEIKQCLKWLDSYCKENSCSQEDALNEIIEE
ncbi:MAG TPA: hypothetical protein P5556_01705 [Candidatus Gastranaerophilales bacterium]|nr:hypothetical protein [Candidatus Gastranaerophilales bacterium]